MPEDDFDAADPNTTGQVMQFRVIPLASQDNSVPPERLNVPPLHNLGSAGSTRQVSLNEAVSDVLKDIGPRAAMLGTVNRKHEGVPRLWMDEIIENPP